MGGVSLSNFKSQTEDFEQLVETNQDAANNENKKIFNFWEIYFYLETSNSAYGGL